MTVEEKKICGICHNKDLVNIIDLGFSPIANKFCAKKNTSIQTYPLVIDFCIKCFNIQLRHCFDASYLYDDSYCYSTPVAVSLECHYSETLGKLVERNLISNQSSLVEIGSNNGNFLAAIRNHAGRILGVDPAANVSAVANSRGIPTITGFFNEATAQTISVEFGEVDLLVARHMFAHNSLPSKILDGVRACLAPGGTLLIENAYAVETLFHGEFDQVYHEHMFYYSASSMDQLTKSHGFQLYDIYFSEVHGGSASFLICNEGERIPSLELNQCLEREQKLFTNKETILDFRSKVFDLKVCVNNFLKDCQKSAESIAIYSVPNKLFTFLSFIEFPLKDIKFMVDTSAEKVGKFYPNSNIEIISEAELLKRDCDVFIIGAWNYKKEILEKSSKIFKPGTKLVFALPFFDVVIV